MPICCLLFPIDWWKMVAWHCFFLMGHSHPVFHLFLPYLNWNSFDSQLSKVLPMTRFDLQISGVGSDCSSNSATITAMHLICCLFSHGPKALWKSHIVLSFRRSVLREGRRRIFVRHVRQVEEVRLVARGHHRPLLQVLLRRQRPMPVPGKDAGLHPGESSLGQSPKLNVAL